MTRRRRRLVVGGAFLFIALVFTVRVVAPSPIVDLALLVLTDLEEFSLEGYGRLLVVAPHFDDETLGAGGLILAATRQGIDVRVAIATNGDNYLQATIRYLRQPVPTRQDFLRMGQIRQAESLAALEVLGVAPENVIFLGYPERGLPALLGEAHWSTEQPYRATFTRAIRSPFPVTYNAEAVYAGADLYGDLLSLLRTFRPDLIVLPHPCDEHLDHWALSAFVRLAIASHQVEDPTYRPDALAYLVHNGEGYPYWRGLHKEAFLVPPARLAGVTSGWVTFPLEPEDIDRKLEAIEMYRSQHITIHNLLVSFARSNELFQRMPITAELPVAADGEPLRPLTWLNEAGEPVEPLVRDPTADSRVRRRLPSIDLIALHTALDAEGDLLVCAQLADPPVPAFSYVLRVIAVGPEGVAHRSVWFGYRQANPNTLHSPADSFCNRFTREELGDPGLVLVGAETRLPGSGLLDRTAEAILLLGEPDVPEPAMIAVAEREGAADSEEALPSTLPSPPF